MSFYNEWGYKSNPFKPNPLKASEKDKKLLVGRDSQKTKLIRRIQSDAGIVTVEGENGIGKTSLINVALFDISNFTSNKQKKKTSLFIPCNKIFQLKRDGDAEDFEREVFLAVAQTLLKYSNSVRRVKKSGDRLLHLDAWLNSPETVSINAQIGMLGGGEARELNTSEGFIKSGIKKTINDWMERLFEQYDTGGVVCVIDNLELLKTSKHAKDILENLRDVLFTLPNLKWVFSGSHGIINTIAGSPRLSGFLTDPIKLESLKSTYILALLHSRVELYSNHLFDVPYIPIRDEDFVSLYKTLNGNLRETLRKLSTYYLYVSEQPNNPDFEQDKKKMFYNWFDADREKLKNEVLTSLDSLDKKLFDLLCDPTKYSLNEIGFDDIKSVIASLDQLEHYGLVIVPVSDRPDLDMLDNGYGSLDLDGEIGLKLIDDSMNRILTNVLLTPKGHLLKNTFEL